jgi:putative nucleotide binding protein
MQYLQSQVNTENEEHAIILDYLPYGYPMGKRTAALAQAIGVKTFALLELVPRRGIALTTKEKVYIGPEKREKIYYIAGRLSREKLTETAKIQLQEFVAEMVGERKKEFIDFFNSAQAINTRLHQLELLPGFGKKHTHEIIEARNQKKFSSFEDIKERVKSVPDPKKAVEKRLMEELLERQRFNLFVK